MTSSKFASLSTIFLLTSNLPAWCFDLQLFECPCAGTHCGKGVNNEEISVYWRTFTYPVDHNGSELEEANIRLVKQTGQVSCHPNDVAEKILINYSDADNVEGYAGVLQGSLQGTNKTVLIQINRDGVLATNISSIEWEELNPNSFCIRRLNTSHASVEICCGHHRKSCIRKCCPSGQIFTNDNANPCVHNENEQWSIPKAVDASSQVKTGNASIKIRTGFPKCEGAYNLVVTLSSSLTKFHSQRKPFRLYQDGRVQYLGAGSNGLQWKNKVDEADYCVDTLSLPENMRDHTCGNDEQDVLLICTKSHVTTVSSNDWVRISRMVYMVAIVVSIFFLLITAISHFLLWEKQNIHAWTILFYVVSLTGFYFCLLAIYVEEMRKRRSLDNSTPFFSKTGCYALGVITHFLGVFSFSWLSVINFDLWWTFRILKPMNQHGLDYKRLICYVSFATAVPTAVVSVAIALQLSHQEGSEPCRDFKEDRTVYPMYGQEICFLKNSAQPYYFYWPVGVLLLANLIFYLCTSCQMLRIYNVTRNQRKQKESCELFFKLLLVMGTTWIFQLILAVVESDEDVSAWYFAVFVILDLTNMFQAIAIFIIFVCKRETLRALEQKYTCMKSCLYPFRKMYHAPIILSRSDNGSTKMSRTEITKHNSIDSCSSGGGGNDRRSRRDSELIIFS